MLIRFTIKDTISLQGFRVELINRYNFGISVKIVPGHRFKPRCGKCGCANVILNFKIYQI